MCVCCFFGLPQHAQATQFDISPKVCVVLQQHEFCDLELKISWQTNFLKICVCFKITNKFNAGTTAKRAFSHKARVQVETIYSLVNPHTGSKIATAKSKCKAPKQKQRGVGYAHRGAFLIQEQPMAKILLVEDDLGLQQLTRDYLQHNGLDVAVRTRRQSI